jgi:hypothetical protein
MKQLAITYCLYRRSVASQAQMLTCLGGDFLHALQMCLLGPVEYTPTPMLIYRQKSYDMRAIDDPMYRKPPITIGNLLFGDGLWSEKCWSVLFRGCSLMAQCRTVSRKDRAEAIVAYAWTLTRRYPDYLLREIPFWLTLRAMLTIRRALPRPLRRRIYDSLRALPQLQPHR